MKKYLAMLLAATMTIGSLAACSRNQPDPEPAPEEKPAYLYQNGDYSVSYTVPALDRTLDYLTVSITDDVITIKEYGMKESESMGSTSSAPADDTTSAPAEATSSAEPTEHEAAAEQAAAKILDAYDDAEQKIEQMKAVKDAEEHTYRFMRMMRTALSRAKSGDTAPVSLGKYADGKYESIMPDANSDGWKEYIRLTVADGEIASIEFDAMQQDNPTALITTDEKLNKEETKPSEYYPQIAKNFTEAGDDLTKMLSPTGGGEATKNFGKLMRPLLIQMISGGETKITASRYMDGTYKAQFKDFDTHGWKEYVVLDIQNGVVTVREFDAFHKTDEKKLKSDDDVLAVQMDEKTGTSFFKAVSDMIDSWEQAGNDVTKVDNIVGATVSTNSFKLLIGQILATTAIEGDIQKPLEVERIEVK